MFHISSFPQTKGDRRRAFLLEVFQTKENKTDTRKLEWLVIEQHLLLSSLFNLFSQPLANPLRLGLPIGSSDIFWSCFSKGTSFGRLPQGQQCLVTGVGAVRGYKNESGLGLSYELLHVQTGPPFAKPT
jgi:hypothetical protein